MIDIHIGSDAVWFMVAAYAIASIIALAFIVTVVRRQINHRKIFEGKRREFQDNYNQFRTAQSWESLRVRHNYRDIIKTAMEKRKK